MLSIVADMKLTKIISALKTNVSHGLWSDNKVRTRDFCLSKKPGKAYPLTKMWRWRVTTFDACGRKFRLMPAYHKNIPEFSAILGEDIGADCRILARLEFHQSHAGWHAHVVCGDTDLATPGIVKPSGVRRLPSDGSRHRNISYLTGGAVMNDHIAGLIACDFFRMPAEAPLFSSEGLPWAA
ncbi:MAG: hypothetical protein ACLPN5_15045 [Roseiarcus sp.]